MEPLPMMVKVFLIRLGREYERCKAAGNTRRLIEIEHILGAVARRHPEHWITPIVCRGQNIYRKAHGMEEVYPMD